MMCKTLCFLSFNCNGVLGKLPLFSELCGKTDLPFLALGIFAVRFFAVGFFDVGFFAVQIFHRTKFSPYGVSAVRKFRRKITCYIDFCKLVSMFWFVLTATSVFYTLKSCQVPTVFHLLSNLSSFNKNTFSSFK